MPSNRPRINNNNNRSSYVSPLQRLDALTSKRSPKKFWENDRYADMYLTGECGLFEKNPSSYRFYFINSETSTETLVDLIEFAKETKTYTLDTEDQQRFRQPSLGALIQIEFTHSHDRSIVLLIETFYLPPEDSSRFEKIGLLCRTIFSKEHRILTWGELENELSKFLPIQSIQERIH